MKLLVQSLAGAVAAGLLAIPLARAEGGADDARIRGLESRLEALARELQAVRSELAQAKQGSGSAPSKVVAEPTKAEAAEKSAEKAGDKPPRRKDRTLTGGYDDGFVVRDASGDYELKLNGRVQVDYRSFSPDKWLADEFDIRRARLSVSLDFLDYYTVRVEGEFDDNTELTNGYLDINWFKPARIRLGQFLPYWGLENSDSSNYIDFMERSLGYNVISDLAYDRGIMVRGAPVKGMYYSVSYTNGTGQNVDERDGNAEEASNDNKDWTARLVVDAARLAGIDNAVIHFGGSINSGRQADNLRLDARTEARGVTFFDTLRFERSRYDRDRYTLEGALAWGPAKLQGEWFRARYDGTMGGVKRKRDIDAWYASVNWLVTGESYADFYSSGLFGGIEPKRNFALGKGLGAVELGLRYSRYDAGDFIDVLRSGDFTHAADAWTLGAKWILNPHTRLMVNYVRTDFDTPIRVNGRLGDDEQALNFRGQIDF